MPSITLEKLNLFIKEIKYQKFDEKCVKKYMNNWCLCNNCKKIE